MSDTFLYRRAYVTYAIIGVNALVFLLMNVRGGAKAFAIYRGVAVVVPQELDSIAWWKLLAANFFHIDFPHLAANVIALCLLGAFVEFDLGPRKYIFIYLVTGVVSMFMLIVYGAIFNRYVPALRVEDPQISAGASASIMGVLGARGAVFFRKWMDDGSRVARNHFAFVILLILLQIFVDLSSLNLSFGAHFTGAFLGYTLALLMKHDPLDLSAANPFSLACAVKGHKVAG